MVPPGWPRYASCMRILLVALAALGAAAVHAEAYRWVDENGVVHYSDRPAPGAEEIQLPEANTYSSPRPARAPARSSARRSASAAADAGRADGSVGYARLEVVSPAEEETLWNIAETLEVRLAIEPELAQNDAIRVYYDGTRVEDWPSRRTRHTIDQVYRGEHTLQAAIVDTATGEVRQESPVRRFYVQQTSILN